MALKKQIKSSSKPAAKAGKPGKAGSNGEAGKAPGFETGVSKTWKKARETTGDSGFQQPTIADGTYVARIKSVTSGVFKAKPAAKGRDGKMKPATPATTWVIIKMVIQTEGEFQGLQPFRRDTLNGATEEEATANIERFCKTLQALDYDTSELEPSDIPGLCKELTEAQPLVQITVKNKDQYLNVYINKLVDES